MFHKVNLRRITRLLPVVLCLEWIMPSCKKDSVHNQQSGNQDTSGTVVVTPSFDINSIHDTYEDVAPFTYYQQWGSYNVHDPSIKKFGDTYYCYSTDVAYGTSVRPGIQIRKSKDLVQWQFVGWVFPSLPAQGAQYIQSKGASPNNALWAPYVMKVNNEYRLYYSLSSAVARLSVIGLATASSPEGPWTEKGLVVSSQNDNTIQTNAIDPTVIVSPGGDHYLYYGSGWDGIYMLKLDPQTGLALNPGDKGKRIANRGFTAGKYNGNIEGAEIIYNSSLQQYYLFIAYDWLETKYNVRVARGSSPEGPFYDFNGKDVNADEDHGPMIIAPYKFNGHGGWQGVSHCTVFDDNGQYFIAHQGRPGVNKYFMDLHVRKLFWTSDGWPVASPERYAGEDNSPVAKDSLAGNWERVVLNYRVVPGYANEQVSPDFQIPESLNLASSGIVNNDAGSKWTYNEPWLQLQWSNGTSEKLFVQKGRDWENKRTSIIFSGLDQVGNAVWGKKIL